MKDGEEKSVLLFVFNRLCFLIRRGSTGTTKWGDKMNHRGAADVNILNLLTLSKTLRIKLLKNEDDEETESKKTFS